MRSFNKIKSNMWFVIMAVAFSSFNFKAMALEEDPNHQWQPVKKVLHKRVEQKQIKRKVSYQEVDPVLHFLHTHSPKELPHIYRLQKTLPKTTLELVFAIQSRGLDKREAERIAAYLLSVPAEYSIKNIRAFDENTSHIIGREWHEIDYSGEGMTWQKQQSKYRRHKITNFKTLDNVKSFFVVESKLPYFKRIYYVNPKH